MDFEKVFLQPTTDYGQLATSNQQLATCKAQQATSNVQAFAK